MLEMGKRPMRRLHIWIAVAAIAALGSAASASSASALPATFWGVVPQGLPTTEQLQRLKAGRVGSIRVPVSWALVQPSPGAPFDWASVDPIVANASMAGIQVLPFLSGAPSWAVPADPRWGSPKNLPVRTGSQRAYWQAFLTQAVLRYGPQGSFWAENPAVPKRPIRTWQVWNEENFMYFVARPNPAEYGKLVKISYTALKAADPGAKIVLGGMFSRPNEATRKLRPPQAYFAADFLAGMYASTPGIKSKFQGVALHPYTSNFKRLTPYIEDFREVLEANHDAGKQLWITELGWSSDKPVPNDSFSKGPKGQVTQLKGAMSLLRSKKAQWRIRGIYWFSLEDGSKASCNFCGGSGLFGPGFVPKASWRALVKFTGGNPG